MKCLDCKQLPRVCVWVPTFDLYISWQVAENLVQRDGDFLIRDSLSSPGSYVLTSQWRNEAQHFKINKKVRGSVCAVTANTTTTTANQLIFQELMQLVKPVITEGNKGTKSMNHLVGVFLHCLLQVVKLNDAYIKVEYRLEREGFDNVPALIRYYVGNRKPVSHVGLLVFCISFLLNHTSCSRGVCYRFVFLESHL